MFDILLKNGYVCDGTGAPCFQADIGITGDRIAFIGKAEEGEAAKTIDVSGRVITPGFIDSHTHADLSFLMEPDMEPFVRQGVTTIVTGNCGYGMAPQGEKTFYCFSMNHRFQELAGADAANPLPLIYERKKALQAFEQLYHIRPEWKSFDEYNRLCDEAPLGCNAAPLLGYSAVRTAVMGFDCCREATETELGQMRQLVKESMEAGAFGISTGRDPSYLPGPFASDAEMQSMLKTVAQYGGIFASHTANYDAKGMPDRIGGYAEMFRQADETGIKVHVSHVHVMNMAEDEEGAAEAARKTLCFFRQAEEKGVDLSCDVIPSPSCCNFTLTSFGYYLKPFILLAGSSRRLVTLWQTKAFREEIHRLLEEGRFPAFDIREEDNLLADLCVLKHKNPLYVGKPLTHCARLMGVAPFDAALDLFVSDPEMVADFVAPVFAKAVDILCEYEKAMPCSDGFGFSKETNLTGCDEFPAYPNSMNIGLIPRYLTRYGLGKGQFEKAVRQASGYPAERFGIRDRGLLKTGYYADLVVIDTKTLHSFDEEENPLQDPQGIDYVLINGSFALTPDGLTGAGAGRILRKTY